jgi:hypothetical protein
MRPFLFETHDALGEELLTPKEISHLGCSWYEPKIIPQGVDAAVLARERKKKRQTVFRHTEFDLERERRDQYKFVRSPALYSRGCRNLGAPPLTKLSVENEIMGESKTRKKPKKQQLKRKAELEFSNKVSIPYPLQGKRSRGQDLRRENSSSRGMFMVLGFGS